MRNNNKVLFLFFDNRSIIAVRIGGYDMVYGKSVRTSRWQKDATSFFCVIIAALIMSTNIKSFVRAGDLIPGGFTGLSLLIQRIFSFTYVLLICSTNLEILE